ncbi:hypothetical protein KJQ82_00150 [Campylobacter lari]|uniref:hypothetical protein n=1 Tax=Campylobacter lari TaxID=201 RepID=UPI0012885974|nr:hypothetical protein [Campylobacter lari]MBT0830637.1 hypothetical protein [Campylobacter lari]
MVEDDLKIPYVYAKQAGCLRNIFELKIQNMSAERTLIFSKVKQFCPYSHKIIKAYKEGNLNKLEFEAKKPKYALAKLIQNVFLSPIFIYLCKLLLRFLYMIKFAKAIQNLR